MSELNIILNNVNRFTTAELEGLVARSPYFQQAHLLLAKKYQLEGNPKFDQQLQLAALYTRDRELLFELFKDKDIPTGAFTQAPVMPPVQETQQQIILPEEIAAEEPEIKQELQPISSLMEETEAKREEEPTVYIPPIWAELKTKEEETVTLPIEEVKETKHEELTLIPLTPEELVIPKLDPEEEVVLTIDVDRAAEVPDAVEDTPILLDEPLVRETEDVLNEQPIGEEELSTPEETLLQAEEELQTEIAVGAQNVEPQIESTPIEEVVIETQPQEEFAVNEPHTFSEWLKAFAADTVPATVEESEAETMEELMAQTEAREEPVSSVETVETKAEEPRLEPAKDELDTIIQQNISADYLHNIVQEETNYTRGLNKFIDEQKKKKAAATAKRQGDEAELDPEMITETMAKIYEMQKKYTKAIKAYEVLSLKYPEKSALFGARINYLKNVI